MESVFNQDFKDFEFLIVDGNSNDGSKEILESYADRLTNFVTEVDNGIYHAMNKGIRMATGRYLLFLNSGDTLIDNNVLKHVNEAINENIDLYYGDILFQEPTKTKKIISPSKLTFDFFFTENLPHQASFIRRGLFDELFHYNEDLKIVSDWEFLIYAVCKANISYKHIPIVVSLYDGNGISSNSSNYKMMYSERDSVLKRHFPAFIKDYEKISQLKHKRFKHFLAIKKHSLAWRILKTFMSLLLVFIPKPDLK